MNRLEFDSIFGEKIRLWVLSGNNVLLSKFFWDRKKAASRKTPGWQVPRRADESDGVHRRVLADDSLCFFFRGAGYDAVTLSFSWVGGGNHWTPPTGQRRRCSNRSCWVFLPCLGSISCFPSRFADRAGREKLLATTRISFEEPRPEYAVLWYASVGAAVAPVATRWGSRFITSFWHRR